MGENILVMERPSQGSGVKIYPIRHTSVVVQSSKDIQSQKSGNHQSQWIGDIRMEWILVHELDKKIAGVEIAEKSRRIHAFIILYLSKSS